MANHTGLRKKIHIGGTIDSDVAEWLMKTKGDGKFSAHLNEILRESMSGRASKGSRGDTASLKKFKSTVDNLRNNIKSLQDRVEGIEAGMGLQARAFCGKAPERTAQKGKARRRAGRPVRRAR